METRVVTVSALVAMVATLALYGVTPLSFQYLGFEAVLAVASALDLRTRTIPNACVAAGIAVRLAYFGALGWLGRFDAAECVLSAFGGIGLFVAMLVFAALFEHVKGRPGMGGGDIKLYGLSGFYFGFEAGLGVVFVSCLAAIAASALMTNINSSQPEWAARKNRVLMSHTLPFGPAIALACVIVILATAG